MGLLLKHRGGPGFGSGRIKGDEATKFEELAGQITDALRQEAIENQGQAPPASDGSPGGAIATKPRVPPGDRINSMIACVEGAIQMYKNSPAELQDGMLVTLRAALLSAVSTCNELVSDVESRQYEEFRTVTSDVRTRNAAVYDVETVSDAPPEPPATFVPETEPAATDPSPPPPSSYTGNDSNTEKLKAIYEKLKDAAGDGQLGLRDDLESGKASDLADELSHMRALLVDELDTGIPEEPSTTSASPSSNTKNKYQELLAKTKAEKKNNE